jgi:hypothetical protein
MDVPMQVLDHVFHHTDEKVVGKISHIRNHLGECRLDPQVCG